MRSNVVVGHVKTINTELFQAFKPSSHVAVSYTVNGKRHQITPFQHDVLNYLCYQSRKQIHQKYNLVKLKNNEKIKSLEEQGVSLFSDDDIVNWLRSFPIEIDIDGLLSFTGRYGNKNKSRIKKILEELQNVHVSTVKFKTDATAEYMQEDSFLAVSRIRRKTNSKTITVWLESEMMLGWVFDPDRFADLYLKMITTLDLEISKRLYEILADYQKMPTPTIVITKNFQLWKTVLGIRDTKSSSVPSRMINSYLKRSIEEINEKTDINIIKIFGKKNKGEVHMTVEFEKQPKARRKELGLIKPDITDHRFYIKSKTKIEKLIKDGYPVKSSVESLIKADLYNNEEIYEAQDKLDAFIAALRETTVERRRDYMSDLAEFMESTDPVVTLSDDDYLIKDLQGRSLTRSAIETREVMIAHQKKQEEEIAMENMEIED